MDKVVQKLKESWEKIPEKTRKLVIMIAGGTLVLALAAMVLLAVLGRTGYTVLFTGLSQDEAQQIGGLLQDDGVDYQYDANKGSIRVPEKQVEQLRVSLLSRGYPKSGFAYDMYLDNTGLMTTESDKKQITLYELQDRLGATIRSFDGVQEARVLIAEESEQRYVLQDSTQESASASVVVTMNNGASLTEDKAQAIKNLIAHAVRGMTFSEVVVLDGATMLEVGSDSGSSVSSNEDMLSLTALVENQIEAKIRKVLEKLYGAGNIAVSVKGTMNMEKLIQEVTEYSTPEKINETDKTGLLQQEDVTSQNSGSYAAEDGGVVGADADAETPRYVNEDGTGTATENYANSSASRTWLFNVLKEQRQIDPGILEDTSVAIIILTNDTQSVTQAELIRLVANAAGISVDVADDKISIIRSDGGTAQEPIINPQEGVIGTITTFIPLPLLIALIALLVLIFLLVLFLLLRRKRKKKGQIPEDDFGGGDQLSASELGIGEDQLSANTMVDPSILGLADDDELNKSEEILNLRMQRSMRLKQSIAEFVDQNPQIAAKLVQSWLRGEEDLDGGSRNPGGRKQSK